MTKVKNNIRKNKFLRILLRIVLFLFLIIVILFVGIYLFLNSDYGKGKIVQYSIETLNKDFKTDISVEDLSINWQSNIVLHGLVVKDHKKFPFIKSKKLVADINIIELVQKLYAKDFKFSELLLDKITLKEPEIRIITYKNEDQDNFNTFIALFDDGKKSEGSPFKLQGDFSIENGFVSIVNQNNMENPIWIDACNVNIDVENFNLIGSTIDTKLTRLNFKAKRNKENYELKNLSAHVYYSDTLLALDSFSLETQSSLLKGNHKFRYSSAKDFSNFNTKILWETSINSGSSVSGKDIRYFSTDWNTNALYAISSTLIEGQLEDLVLNNLVLSSQHVFLQTHKLTLNQILRDNYTIDVRKANINISNEGLKKALPTFITSKLRNHLQPFGIMQYKGDANITPKNIVVKGNLNSRIGYIDVNGFLANYTENNPKYQGTIIGRNVNLTPLTGDNTLGNFSGIIAIEGSGLNLNTINTQIKSNFSSLNIAGYTIQNLKIDGIFAKKIFNGNIITNDAYSKLNLKGMVDISNSMRYKLNINGNIDYANLYHYKIIDDTKARFSGYVDTNISFSKLSDLEGTISLKNAIYENSNKSLALQSVDITSVIQDKIRSLYIDIPSFVNGKVVGNYNLNDLPEMFKNGLGNLLVGYKPSYKFPNKFIAFNLDVEDDIISTFIPSVEFDYGSKLNGYYNGYSNDLRLSLSSPNFYYDGIRAENLQLFVDTQKSTNQLKTLVDKLYINETTLSDISIDAYKENDSLFVNTKLAVGENQSQKINLNVFQIYNGNNVEIGILPSTVKVNGIAWKTQNETDLLSKQNYITYNTADKTFLVENINFYHEESSVSTSGKYVNSKDFNFDIDLDDILLEKFIPKDFTGNIAIKGLLNGDIKLLKKSDKLEPKSNVTIENLDINDNLLGNFASRIAYDIDSQKFIVDANITKGFSKNLKIEGTIDNSKPKPELELTTILNDFDMKVLGSFLKVVFSNMRGKANGEIQFNGPYDALDYNGDITFSDFGFKVDYLGVDYQFKGTPRVPIYGNMNDVGTIQLDDLEFYDQKQKTKGIVVGVIQNYQFSSWNLFLDFASLENKGLMVLDTKQAHNELFYGNVFTKGEFLIQGNVNNLNISANATVLKNSEFNLNINATSSVDDDFKWITFTNQTIDSTAKKILKNREAPEGLSMNLNLEIEEGAGGTIFIDDKTDSYLQVSTKSERLNFAISSKGEITMNGDLSVVDGKYRFGLVQGLFRDFTIDRNSNLSWKGDPYEPDININAYFTQNVSNLGQYLNLGYQVNTEAKLNIQLTEKLTSPKINFEVNLPKASSDVKESLQQRLDNNPDEKFSQFTSILMLRQLNTSSGEVNGLENNAYSILINQMLNFINTIAPEILRFDADVITSNYNGESSDIAMISNQINLDSRTQIKGGVGIPLNNKDTRKDNVKWNVELEYDISKKEDKSTVLRAFSKPSAFGSQSFTFEDNTNNQIYGGGIVWRRSFNSLKELFSKKDTTILLMRKDSTKTKNQSKK